jgi:tetratricopeptide (TPR) repeat protein
MVTKGDENTARYMAAAHYRLGKMCYGLSRYDDSCRELETARTQFRQLGKPSDILQAGEAAAYLVGVFIMMNKTSDQVFSVAREAQADLRGDQVGSARALAALGYSHFCFHRDKHALEELETARATLEESGCFEDVAGCLFRMSECYLNLGDLQNCLSTCEKGLKFSKQAGLDARIYAFLIIFAQCHIRLEHYDEALKLCRESLPLTEALGVPLGNAQILDLIGYTLTMKKEYEGALLAYARARTEYSNTDKTSTSTKGLARCDYNISQINRARGRGEEGVMLEVPFRT